MPELPEVQTVASDLHSSIKDLEIQNINVLYKPYIQNVSSSQFTQSLKQTTIKSVKRRGKYIIYTLDTDLHILQHLRMTGRALVRKKDTQPTKHTHVIFSLSQDTELHIEDTRKFGRLWLFKNQPLQTYLKDRLGPEPLKINQKQFLERIKAHRRQIKALLLDQAVIAGLGNIYVDESLFSAKIHPQAAPVDIPIEKLKDLHQSIQDTLKKAINSRGTSFSDYLDGRGNAGRYVEFLNAYGRAGLPCKNCETILEKTTVTSRTTIFCPKCQKI